MVEFFGGTSRCEPLLEDSDGYLHSFLDPRSVAVIKASRDPSKIVGIAGRIVPVNVRATTVQALPASPSLQAVDGPVDLAVMAVDARART